MNKSWVQALQVLEENQARKHTLHVDDVVIDPIMLQRSDALSVVSVHLQNYESITGQQNYEMTKHENTYDQQRK